MLELHENHRERVHESTTIDRCRIRAPQRVLGRFENKDPMNLEQLDGFFAALICGPGNVPPSEYLPVILGDDMVLEDTVNAQPVLQDFLSSFIPETHRLVKQN
jgi:hypothetical protein